MHDQQKLLQQLRIDFQQAWDKSQLDHKTENYQALERQSQDPDLWRDPDHARQVHEDLAHLTDEIQPWQMLKTQLTDLDELLDLGGEELEAEITDQLTACQEQFETLKKSLRFTSPYDHLNAIIRLSAGAGGVEAMDWCSMLERMYLRFAEHHHFKVTCFDRISGEEAGIKSAAYEITGPNAYGLLKSEHGVHRLVRLSPFNADHLRQTSFALVEVLPVIPPSEALEIPDKDLRIDTYHSSGHGGQGVNTTNSAVRITHLPTGIAVAIQNERSQQQNRAKAMEILRGKLQRLQDEQHAASTSDLRATESASWGQQIRNYVLQPYKLVKDTRTKHESSDPDKVLDGNIDEFIDAYLEN